MTAIVQVNVSQQVAPSPNLLQQTGAIISQGGFLTAPGTVSLITQPSDATSLYNGGKGVSSLAWAAGVVTVTTAQPHGFTLNEPETVQVTLAGFTPTAYNGTFAVTATGASTFTFPLAANPGAATVTGVYTLADVAELLSQITTFFAQGANQAVYVLELGEGDPADGVAALSAYITANAGLPQPVTTGALPNRFYSYLVPREWNTEPTFLTLLQSSEAPSSQLYFHVTTTLSTFQQYTPLMKNVISYVEAPPYGIWPANALTAISYAAGVVTATTATAHGVLPGQWFQIQGVVPTGYNGYWLAQPGTTGSTLVFNSPTVLAAETTLGTLIASYTASAGITSKELTAASGFRQTLQYRPSSTNRVTPFAFSFLYGVTPFPTRGNAALLQTMQNAATNYVDTGAEGGISNTILKWGTTQDGNDFTYWYSADWMQINLDQDLANAVINGSNNPVNPLYYDQNGINTLLGVIAQRCSIGVANGLVLGTPVQTSFDGPTLAAAIAAGTYAGQTICNAVPFITYSNLNPGDYKIGRYAGFSVIYTPRRGFINVVVNLVISSFVSTGNAAASASGSGV